MRPWAALEIALALAEQPELIRGVSLAPLPSGVTLLLELAAGEPAALDAARSTMTLPHPVLQKAADNFVERVLFSQTADSYRILGARRTATRKQMRRHMVLLVKWLHRNASDWSLGEPSVDRSILFPRVTQAWDHLKSDARRAAYDQMLGHDSSGAATPWRPALTAALGPARNGSQLIAYKKKSRLAPPRLVIYRLPNDTLFSRLLYYLGRHA